jgi:hypothetical protein
MSVLIRVLLVGLRRGLGSSQLLVDLLYGAVLANEFSIRDRVGQVRPSYWGDYWYLRDCGELLGKMSR